MTMLLRLLAVIMFVSMSACANTDYFEPAMVASPGNAVVYVYRPAASNPGKKPLRTSYPEIQVDGEAAGLLKYNQYLSIELPPGNYTFLATGLTQNARWEPRNVSSPLTVEADKHYFMRLRVEFDTDKMTIGSFSGQYLIHLHPVAESEAVYEIRHTSASE